jgi:hypothetical protein
MTANRDHSASAARFRLGHKVERGGALIFVFGLVGLRAGGVSRWSAGVTEAEQTASGLGSFLVRLFLGAFVGGLLIVLPFSSLLRRRASRLASVDAAGEIDAGGGRQWQLPGWLGWPLWAITTAAALYLIYMLVRYGIPMYFARGR